MYQMFCVIQELPLKNPYYFGHGKTIETYTSSSRGRTVNQWRYSSDKFDRPIKKAYKISVHQSKRVNGKVTKKQYVICTIEHYWTIGYGFTLDEFPTKGRIKKISSELGVSEESICDLIYAKVDPLVERILSEFEQTEEYKTELEHDRIINTHCEKRNAFKKKYKCSDDDYDSCYDVFGKLTDKEFLKEIKQRAKLQKEEEKARYYQYYEDYEGDYTSIGIGTTSFDESEKLLLKDIYRTLTKEYHPDLIKGSEEHMKLINKLKESWNI